jgi:hypothetical protein
LSETGHKYVRISTTKRPQPSLLDLQALYFFKLDPTSPLLVNATPYRIGCEPFPPLLCQNLSG